MRKAAVSAWNLVSPFAAGIGIASAAVSFIIGLYYNTMVAWTLLYLFASATSARDRPLPFAVCPAAQPTGARMEASRLQPPTPSTPTIRSASGSPLTDVANSTALGNNSSETECQVSSSFAFRRRRRQHFGCS